SSTAQKPSGGHGERPRDAAARCQGSQAAAEEQEASPWARIETINQTRIRSTSGQKTKDNKKRWPAAAATEPKTHHPLLPLRQHPPRRRGRPLLRRLPPH